MTPFQKLKHNRRGFTLAELMIVVALIAILAGIAFAFIRPSDISQVEYNRSAEAIATAVQNRLTEIRNTGDMAKLRVLGEQAKDAENPEASKTSSTISPTAVSDGTQGGYRYVFNYTDDGGTVARFTGISYLVPFGSIEYELSQNYYAIGFQSDTGMVGEVFYSTKPFGARTVDYLLQLQASADKRKAEGVGYYQGEVDSSEVAFANLPTPQVTITNHEELKLSIYLPEVKQLQETGKQLGILISLADEDEKAYSNLKMKLTETAIYSTFKLGYTATGAPEEPVINEQTINPGATYTMILDTVQPLPIDSMNRALALSHGDIETTTPPAGIFEDWLKRSDAFGKGDCILGDNSMLTVTVYCLMDNAAHDDPFPVDPRYMPRSVSVSFNGWFNNYGNSKAEIACGRHLQNLSKLAELRKPLVPQLPTVTTDGNGNYIYGPYNYGMAKTYTDGSSHASDPVDYDDIAEKYDWRDNVKHIRDFRQVRAIDFDCDEWKTEGKQLPFTPINFPDGVTYYGNYLTISNLYVDAPFYAGLFGYSYHAKLYDILLVNPSVQSQAPAHLAELYEMGVGALIGTSRHSSEIANCQAYMTPKGGNYDATKRVAGEAYVGGLIGFCEDESISNCSASVYTGYAKGAQKTVATKDEKGTVVTTSVPASSKYVGGLIGCISGDGSISECYAAGNLSGEYVGGLLGYVCEDSDPSGDEYRISTCYTAGHIEYATEEASGILGCVRELAGNARSALSIYRNYCAIIYGVKSGSGYVWDCTKKEGDATVAVPIYGTFKGDGFEWLRTDRLGYSDTYLTGTYAGNTYFVGASFVNDNKNYYIAQKGIEYSSSPYYTAMAETVQKIVQNIKSNQNDAEKLQTAITEAREQLSWLKKLQTLEQLKEVMEKLIYEVDNETGTYTVTTTPEGGGDPVTTTYKYNEGGYYQYGRTIYYDTSRARVEGSAAEKDHTYKAMTLVEALHVMYNGKLPDGTEVTQTYGGSDTDKKRLNTYSVYTFMDYYNKIKETLNSLLKATTEEAKEPLRATLVDFFGDNTNESYQEPNSKGELVTYGYYMKGMFYKYFYSDLLHRLFDKAKDYYQEDIKDNTGELIYRHFRDIVTGDFENLLGDIGISTQQRDAFLLRVKQQKVQAAIDGLTTDIKVFDLQAAGSGPMKNFAAEAKGYAENAITPLNNLLSDLQKANVSTATLQADIANVDAQLKPLYTLLDAHKAGNDGANEADWDIIDVDGNKGDMRKLRDPVSEFRKNVALAIASSNSGVENALIELSVKLQNNEDAETAVAAFETAVNTYLGAHWENTDSGHRLYNATQLRNATRGYIYGTEDGPLDDNEHLGFMYDYNNSYKSSSGNERNPYYGNVHVDSGNDAYVDEDHGVYNNVFPYLEGEYTGYYPFPFVYGASLELSGERISYILFHYGDWLTEDLWASNDPAVAALEKTAAQMSAMSTGLQEALDSIGGGNAVGNVTNAVTALKKSIENCEETVKEALELPNTAERKTKLTSIYNTIDGWLGKNGDFTVLQDRCDKFQGNDKKTVIEDVAKKLALYREQLVALLEEIKLRISG